MKTLAEILRDFQPVRAEIQSLYSDMSNKSRTAASQQRAAEANAGEHGERHQSRADELLNEIAEHEYHDANKKYMLAINDECRENNLPVYFPIIDGVHQ